MIKGIQGPAIPQSSTLDLELPDCIKIETEQDAQEFQDFIAAIINGARQAWEQEPRK